MAATASSGPGPGPGTLPDLRAAAAEDETPGSSEGDGIGTPDSNGEEEGIELRDLGGGSKAIGVDDEGNGEEDDEEEEEEEEEAEGGDLRAVSRGRKEGGARRASVSTVASFQLYTPDEERAVVRKFDRKLVIFVALLYMLSFLDRSSEFVLARPPPYAREAKPLTCWFLPTQISETLASPAWTTTSSLPRGGTTGTSGP